MVKAFFQSKLKDRHFDDIIYHMFGCYIFMSQIEVNQAVSSLVDLDLDFFTMVLILDGDS